MNFIPTWLNSIKHFSGYCMNDNINIWQSKTLELCNQENEDRTCSPLSLSERQMIPSEKRFTSRLLTMNYFTTVIFQTFTLFITWGQSPIFVTVWIHADMVLINDRWSCMHNIFLFHNVSFFENGCLLCIIAFKVSFLFKSTTLIKWDFAKTWLDIQNGQHLCTMTLPERFSDLNKQSLVQVLSKQS